MDITSVGYKLPLYVILNSKMIRKNEMFPNDIIVRAQRNGWMTADLMESRVKDVWGRRPGALHNPFSVLVLDMFREDLSEEVKVTFGWWHEQPASTLDGSAKRLSKHYLRKE
jgi:hypothetical protein